MDLNELKDLAFACADKVTNQKLAEMTIQAGEFSITVKSHAPVQQNSFTSVQNTVSNTENIKNSEDNQPKEEISGTVVTAPLVGTFYAANSPDEPPLATVGQKVSKGDTLFIIEAMKTMNAIVSPCDGKISRILVQNGEMVEYKQAVIVIE